MEKFTVEASIENLPLVTSFVIEPLEEKGCSMKILMQMELVIEEIFVNVANYAYPTGHGMATICRDFEDTPRAIELTFIDSGIPYNPLEHEDPDINLELDEREIGGLGIFLVKKTVDEIHYEYKDSQNILTIKKLF